MCNHFKNLSEIPENIKHIQIINLVANQTQFYSVLKAQNIKNVILSSRMTMVVDAMGLKTRQLVLNDPFHHPLAHRY